MMTLLLLGVRFKFLILVLRMAFNLFVQICAIYYCFSLLNLHQTFLPFLFFFFFAFLTIFKLRSIATNSQIKKSQFCHRIKYKTIHLKDHLVKKSSGLFFIESITVYSLNKAFIQYLTLSQKMLGKILISESKNHKCT